MNFLTSLRIGSKQLLRAKQLAKQFPDNVMVTNSSEFQPTQEENSLISPHFLQAAIEKKSVIVSTTDDFRKKVFDEIQFASKEKLFTACVTAIQAKLQNKTSTKDFKKAFAILSREFKTCDQATVLDKAESFLSSYKLDC